MKNYQSELLNFEPKHDFFVGIDSDGCVFNSMEVKHNDSFSVNLIKYFRLATISRQVHQAWDFVNLYSKTRGINRFRAMVLVVDLLREMPKVKQSEVKLHQFPHLREWIENETKLGNHTLTQEMENSTGDRRLEFEQVLEWSLAVNATIAEIVRDLPPFPGVRESLKKLKYRADLMVVSATPYETLKHEWRENRISEYVRLIAGQEMGAKTEQLTIAAKGKYRSENMLMIGDSPGDLNAARNVNALFFPINPGYEEESWKKFLTTAVDRFFAGEYAGDYESKLIEEFEALLPETPPWKVI